MSIYNSLWNLYFTERLDIDYIETIYTQVAILHSIDNEVSYHSQELLQIAEWLHELKMKQEAHTL